MRIGRTPAGRSSTFGEGFNKVFDYEIFALKTTSVECIRRPTGITRTENVSRENDNPVMLLPALRPEEPCERIDAVSAFGGGIAISCSAFAGQMLYCKRRFGFSRPLSARRIARVKIY